MDWAEAYAIYEELNSLRVKSGGPANRLWVDLLNTAAQYAELRTRWALALPNGTKSELDQKRTLAHNAFIDCCNAMSRAMATQGGDLNWRKRLGDHRTREGRKTIGDFACFVHCLLGLSAR